jgi:hypothetical protein
MRVKAYLHFCVAIIEGVDADTGKRYFGECFCTTTADISAGGVCLAHRNVLLPGMQVELSIPSTHSVKKCLECEKAFMSVNTLELEPIYGKVVWATKNRCGITFEKLSVRNDNILSKFIWDEHISDVRNSRVQVMRQRKF